MSSDEARAEAEWRFPVTAYECPEDQATEVERFVAGAEWQAERDAERIAELEAEVEYWDTKYLRERGRANRAEAEVERLRQAHDLIRAIAASRLDVQWCVEAMVDAVKSVEGGRGDEDDD